MASSKTIQANVNFSDGVHTLTTGLQSGDVVTKKLELLKIDNNCTNGQPQKYAANFCKKIKACGHVCLGIRNEIKCLPCLQRVCQARENADNMKQPKLSQDADDICVICLEGLSSKPSIQLECGHVIHYLCLKTVLEKRWSGPRITFSFSSCPLCKADIKHIIFAKILEPINVLKEDVKNKALLRMKYVGMAKNAESDVDIAMNRFAFYRCFKCKKAYYGGEARCYAESEENFNPKQLVCGACSEMCPKHGDEFLIYKCRFCCSVASYFCFGNTHFCYECHLNVFLPWIPKENLPQCPAGPHALKLTATECPLGVVHPPTGDEFYLGCAVCLSMHSF